MKNEFRFLCLVSSLMIVFALRVAPVTAEDVPLGSKVAPNRTRVSNIRVNTDGSRYIKSTWINTYFPCDPIERDVNGNMDNTNVHVNSYGTNYSYPIKIKWWLYGSQDSSAMNGVPQFQIQVNGNVIYSRVDFGNAEGSFVLDANKYFSLHYFTSWYNDWFVNRGYYGSYRVEYTLDSAPPDAPNFRFKKFLNIDGTIYTKEPAIDIDTFVDNPKSFDPSRDNYGASGIWYFEVYDNGNNTYSHHNKVTGLLEYYDDYYDYSYPIEFSEGKHKWDMVVYDNERNSNSSSINFILDQSVGDVTLNIPAYQKDPVTQAKSATISWEAASDQIPGQDLEGAGIKGYQVVMKENNDTQPTDAEIPETLVTETSVEYQNLSSQNIYYVWVRAVDMLGNVSKNWAKIKVCPPADRAEFILDQVTSTSEREKDKLSSYTINLKMQQVDAANYQIRRTRLDDYTDPNGNKTIDFAIDRLQENQYKYDDSNGLFKHGRYKYLLYTINALGQMTDGGSCEVMVANIKPNFNIAEIKGPANDVIIPQNKANFILGPRMDQEKDLLEYQLYLRTIGGGNETMVATWRPEVDNQVVSYEFLEPSETEWLIRYVETDTKILDRKAIDLGAWKLVRIDKTKILPICITAFGESKNGTKNQQLTFKAEMDSETEEKIVRYVWNFGDGTPTVEGREVQHVYTKLSLSSFLSNRVKVTAYDAEGLTYTGEIKIYIKNTTQGQLYADETWSGKVTINSNVLVPLSRKLIIQPGAEIQVSPGASLSIQGELEARDLNGKTVFSGNGLYNWKGIVFNEQGKGNLSGVTITNADQGIYTNGIGTITLTNDIFKGNQTGLSCFGSGVTALDCQFIGNTGYGVEAGNNRNPLLTNCIFEGNGINYHDETQNKNLDEAQLNQIPGNYRNKYN